MIYKSLRTLPMITYIDIVDTGDITLLSNEDADLDILYPIWEGLYEEYQQRYNKQGSNKVFNVVKEIEYLEKKHLIIKSAVEALRFDLHQELIDLLLNLGYTLRITDYNADLDRIERESNGINSKIKMLASTLPKPAENNNQSNFSIVDLMAGYSSIMGFDFDFYTISVEKFHSLEKQVKQKVAAIEKQNAKK